LGSALPLIAIYLKTKFHLNANRKLFAGQGTGWTKQSGDYMLPPLGSIIMDVGHLLCYFYIIQHKYDLNKIL